LQCCGGGGGGDAGEPGEGIRFRVASEWGAAGGHLPICYIRGMTGGP
jgi:hypothetical protein